MNLSEHRGAVTVVIGRFEDVVARGLRALIDEDKGLELVAVGVPDEQLPAAIAAYRPDVTMIDLGHWQRSEISRLCGEFPDTNVFVLASDPTAEECRELVALGATACLPKSSEGGDLLRAIHLASRGLRLLPADA